MKGPYERLKYDFARYWECPVCHQRRRTGGATTARLCRCQASKKPTEAVWMRLLPPTDSSEVRAAEEPSR